MRLFSGWFMTRCFRWIRKRGLRRLSMASVYFDQTVGINKLKRAEAMVLRRRSGDLSGLKESDALECAWAFSTMLVAAQQGLRLAPEAFALAESFAHSRNSTIHGMQPNVTIVPAAASS